LPMVRVLSASRLATSGRPFDVAPHIGNSLSKAGVALIRPQVARAMSDSKEARFRDKFEHVMYHGLLRASHMAGFHLTLSARRRCASNCDVALGSLYGLQIRVTPWMDTTDWLASDESVSASSNRLCLPGAGVACFLRGEMATRRPSKT
jgi:hypothetical protein